MSVFNRLENDKKSDWSSMNTITRWLSWLLVILAFVGFADATYLTAEHFLGGVPVCVITKGCDTVLTSRYSMIGPIPVALVGALYYLVVFLLSLSNLDAKSQRPLQLITVLTGLGFLASAGFLYLQVAVIQALCIYCLTSAGTSTLLFAGSLLQKYSLRS